MALEAELATASNGCPWVRLSLQQTNEYRRTAFTACLPSSRVSSHAAHPPTNTLNSEDLPRRRVQHGHCLLASEEMLARELPTPHKLRPCGDYVDVTLCSQQ